MTWPKSVDWRAIDFGVEIEWVGAPQGAVEPLPGWEIVAEDSLFLADGRMVDPVVSGEALGGELVSPRLRWDDRDQIEEICRRLKDVGAESNWSCGLHVHADAGSWGKAFLLPALDAALRTENALKQLVDTAPHRIDFGPPTTQAIRNTVADAGRFVTEEHLNYGSRPASRRGGINLRPLFDTGSVEFRLPNGTLQPDEIYRTVELWLRWVSAVGRGEKLPGSPVQLAQALGAPVTGYPPRQDAPAWWWRRRAMDLALYPVLLPHCQRWFRELYPHVPEPADIVWIDGAEQDSIVALAESGVNRVYFVLRWEKGEWVQVRAERDWHADLLASVDCASAVRVDSMDENKSPRDR